MPKDRKSVVLVIPTDSVYATGAYVPGGDGNQYRREVFARMAYRRHVRILLSEVFEIIDDPEWREVYVRKFLDNMKYHIPKDYGVEVFLSSSQRFTYKQAPHKESPTLFVVYEGIRATDEMEKSMRRIEGWSVDPESIRNLFE